MLQSMPASRVWIRRTNMAWYYIVLIVLACILVLFGLLFIFFITNGDGKMIEKIYNMLSKYHDNKDIKEKI